MNSLHQNLRAIPSMLRSRSSLWTPCLACQGKHWRLSKIVQYYCFKSKFHNYTSIDPKQPFSSAWLFGLQIMSPAKNLTGNKGDKPPNCGRFGSLRRGIRSGAKGTKERQASKSWWNYPVEGRQRETKGDSLEIMMELKGGERGEASKSWWNRIQQKGRQRETSLEIMIELDPVERTQRDANGEKPQNHDGLDPVEGRQRDTNGEKLRIHDGTGSSRRERKGDTSGHPVDKGTQAWKSWRNKVLFFELRIPSAKAVWGKKHQNLCSSVCFSVHSHFPTGCPGSTCSTWGGWPGATKPKAQPYGRCGMGVGQDYENGF